MFWKTGGEFRRRTDVRLTLLYILTFFFSTSMIFGFLYFRLNHQLIKEVDRLLLDETDELSRVLSKDPSEGVLRSHAIGVEARPHYPIYFRVLNENGTSIYASEGLQGIGYVIDKSVILNAKEKRSTKEKIRSPNRRRPYRFISMPIYRQGKLTYILQVGTHLRFVRKSLSNFKKNMLIAFPIVLLLGTLGGWVLARRALSPIGYIASTTQRITNRNLDERLVPRGTGDEMDYLIRTINDMIARLEASFKRMAEFTADTSHELKTPLCALRGEAEVLLSKTRSAEEYQGGLVHFIERVDHLNRMINDLILLSKSDTGELELKWAPLRLDLLIREIGDFFLVLAEQKGIFLEIDAAKEVTVMGDKVRLQQLFTNLVDNAIKYTAEGRVRVTIARDADAVAVHVSDTGIGIPKEEQERIFRRFYRVDKSRSRETGGVGLGLSIAEWIAHVHKGTIEVNSELDKGSTFKVTLPVSTA